MAKFSVEGKYTTLYDEDSVWHELHTKTAGYAGLTASGTLTVDRNSASDEYVRIKSGTAKCGFTSEGSPSYGFPVSIQVILGGTLHDTKNKKDKSNQYVTGGSTKLSRTSMGKPNCSYSFSDNPLNIKCTDNNAKIYVCFYCGQTGGCSLGYDGTSSGHSEPIVVCTIDTSKITQYNPYTPFSDVTFSSISPVIGRFNDTTFTATYSVTGGTKNLTSVKLRLFDMSNVLRAEYSFGTGKGNNKTGTFIINAPANATGWHYKAEIQVKDGTTTKTSGRRDVYTYMMPTMSDLTFSATNVSSGTTFSPQDNAKVTYTTNSRKWTFSGGENDFTTKCTINGTEVNASSQNPKNNTNETSTTSSSSENISNDILNSRFNANDRSVAKMTGTITMTRINTSASSNNYKASKSLTFYVQYQPTRIPTGGGVTKSDGTSVKGTTIFVQDVPTIKVDWGYPSTSGAAGVVNGYKIGVFKDSACTQLVGSYYYQNGTSKELDTKTQLQRGIMNYVKITPYYYKPNQTGAVTDDSKIILGTQSYTGQLVKPLSKLDAPIIDYPINNTTWHNEKFRILVQSSNDDDIDTLVSQGVITNRDDYRYADIQIRVTKGTNSVTYSVIDNPSIFSKTIANIKHKEKIAICPGILGLPSGTGNTYKVEVRYKKAYYNLTETEAWSKWAEVNVSVEAINNLDLSRGQKILASHYMTPRTASVRLYNVYPIDAQGLKNNVAREVRDIIWYDDYKSIYNTILSIKNGVNNYCVYDNTDVSFTLPINDLTDNPPKQEYITAEKISTSPNGRNYMNILIDYMNDLI